MSGLELYNVDNSVTNDVSIDSIESRYDFAATYLPDPSARRHIPLV